MMLIMRNYRENNDYYNVILFDAIRNGKLHGSVVDVMSLFQWKHIVGWRNKTLRQFTKKCKNRLTIITCHK